MLKNISLHIEKDDAKQGEIEAKLSVSINHTYKRNIAAFKANIPSLIDQINAHKQQSKSIICNKLGEINIVDIGLGRVLYGFHPRAEIEVQFDQFSQHPLFVDMRASSEDPSQLTAFEKLTTAPALPDEPECIVVLGSGLGYHIESLVEKSNARHIIIYEAEPQYFSASMYATKWFNILSNANRKGISLYFQIAKDGRDLISDIQELQSKNIIQGFYLYKHFNTPVYNSIFNDLLLRPWKQVSNRGINFQLNPQSDEYCPEWTPAVNYDALVKQSNNDPLFKTNLEVFKKYYPNIHEQFKDYQPKLWIPVKTKVKQTSVVHKNLAVSWFTDKPKSDYKTSYEHFKQHPNQDGLVLGYSGKKLLHYQHYRFVKKTEALLEENESEIKALPKNVPALILFGLGLGYQLDNVVNHHNVENLFICEPNSDLFYASLYCIDWKAILEKIDLKQGRLYLNIGDDGTNLFRDLLNQFYSIGPYILNQTYFYQGYYNAGLNSAIEQLREQLRVVISVGEYFDHAYYGINQTKEGMRRGYRMLTKSPAQILTHEQKDTPVFIVGNGPSIDHSIETIKEWQGEAIIVSCGTVLQVFHRHNLIPNFHAEIEQNRTTYDWACSIGDLDYLKKVDLLSCNGIHPDTCKLYNDTFVVFKEGESSTLSTLSALQDKNFEILKYAFPTVTNFAANLFMALGFKNIYLLGVDLGFYDKKHHHSKSSAYYLADGTELGDYSEHYNTSLVVPGNFRPQVFTKPEFKMSLQILEKTIADAPKDVQFYNCSDGARIKGAMPLPLENIISTANNKQQVLKDIKSKTFRMPQDKDPLGSFEEKFNRTLLEKELIAFQKLIDKPAKTNGDIEKLLQTQKKFLYGSYSRQQSLFFYLFYGTCNYTSAVLVKTADFTLPKKKLSAVSQQALDCWRETYADITSLVLKDIETFDHSTINILTREKTVLRQKLKGKSLLVVHEGQDSFYEACLHALEAYFQLDIVVSEVSPTAINDSTQADFIIYLGEQPINLYGKDNTTLAINDSEAAAMDLIKKDPNISIIPFYDFETDSGNHVLLSNLFRAYLTLYAATESFPGSLIIPKNHAVGNLVKPGDYEDLLANKNLNISEYYYYFEISLNNQHAQSRAGTRGALRTNSITFSERLLKNYNQTEFDNLIKIQLESVPSMINDEYFLV